MIRVLCLHDVPLGEIRTGVMKGSAGHEIGSNTGIHTRSSKDDKHDESLDKRS
jgi:hypothetical protein